MTNNSKPSILDPTMLPDNTLEALISVTNSRTSGNLAVIRDEHHDSVYRDLAAAGLIERCDTYALYGTEHSVITYHATELGHKMAKLFAQEKPHGTPDND